MGTPPSLNDCLESWIDTSPLTNLNNIIDNEIVPQASGVLPFCILDDKTVFFLLGKESYRKGFFAHGTWCDFGGSINHKNSLGGFDSALLTAAQELLEESIGTCAKDNSNLNDVATYIQNNCYMVVNSFFGKKTPYRMYIVRIPFSNIPQNFQIRHRIAVRFRYSSSSSSSNLVNQNQYMVVQRERLREKMPYLFTKAGRTKRHFLEKDSLQWVSSDVLSQCLDMQNNSSNPFKLRPEFAQTLVKEDIVGKLDLMIKDHNNSTTTIGPPPGFEGLLIKK